MLAFKEYFTRVGVVLDTDIDDSERLEAAIELAGDRSLHEWFQRAVHSTQELQLDEALAGVGVKASIGPLVAE